MWSRIRIQFYNNIKRSLNIWGFFFYTYPIQFCGNTILDFKFEEAKKVSIANYNIMGRLVKMLREGMMEAGNHKLNWKASDIQKGIYPGKFVIFAG